MTAAAVSAQGGKFAYRGFSGGMMVHAGYIGGGNFTLRDASGAVLAEKKLHGFPTGIGGAIKIHLGDHLRVGSEGYVSTLHYGRFDSYSSVGWGGILADWLWRLGRFAPFAGAGFGGGSFKHLALTTDTPVDEIAEGPASFRKYGFLTVVPFAGVEYALTSKIHLTVKADYMINVSNRLPDFSEGPRLFIGFAFYRLKD